MGGVDVGRTEEDPREGNEAEGDETGDKDCQPVVGNMAEDGLGDFV